MCKMCITQWKKLNFLKYFINQNSWDFFGVFLFVRILYIWVIIKLSIMKKTAILVFGLFFILAANAQNRKSKTISKGKTTSIERSISDFTKLDVAGSFDVVLSISKTNKINLEGDENIIPYLKTEIVEDVLKIYLDNPDNLNFKGSVKINVPVKQLNELSFRGSGTIFSNEGIKSEKFKLEASGSGDLEINIISEKSSVSLKGSGSIKIKGTTNELSLSQTGSGDINAANFISKNAEADLKGSGSIKINVTNNLKANLQGSGDINYSGNPKNVDKKIGGSGSISKS